MKLREYQILTSISNDLSGDFSHRERIEAQRKLDTDPVAGTVFVPVYFGSGRAKGEAVDSIRRGRGLKSTRQVEAAIKAAKVTVAGGHTAYTDRAIAEAIGADHVGMGSCTNYAICEADPESVHDCDISESRGKGWRRA